jgi:hypothetical protein
MQLLQCKITNLNYKCKMLGLLPQFKRTAYCLLFLGESPHFDAVAPLGPAFFTYLSIQLIISASVCSTDSRAA